MLSFKERVGDLLFAVLVILTCWSSYTQIVRFTTSAQGVSVSWFLFWLIFLVINLHLAVEANKVKTSRTMRQAIWSYCLSATMIVSYLLVMWWFNTGEWTNVDSWTTVFASLGIVFTLVVARVRGLTYHDPIVKGVLSVFFKAVPQLMLAYGMYATGRSDLTAPMVFMGHVAITIRLVQLAFVVQEASQERNRRGSAISELTNFGSWIIATGVWLSL
jgi:hypothetical protein